MPVIPVDKIRNNVLQVRGKTVMLDSDLADICGVHPKSLNAYIREHVSTFPEEFVFQLTTAEKSELIAKHRHLAKLSASNELPYAFTENGALMIANLLEKN